MNRKIKNKNGITLIALIVTIVLMLILASVSISMLVNDEIFDYAGQAVEETEKAKNDEQELVNTAINDYIKPNLKITGHDGETFSKIYTKTENYTDTEGNTAVIPKGFAVGTSTGINKISTGLVIRDSEGNEFIWIPVTEDLEASYEYTAEYAEPAIISKYDVAKGYTQKGFEKEYTSMVNSVNKNKGFYIGRYETTIDDNKIGTKYSAEILTSNEWYSLYENAKKANVANNGTNVQTAMIYGQLWDETMAYITLKDTNYDVNTGAPYGTEEGYSRNETKYAGTFNLTDKALNIWGLRSSRTEWTQEIYVNGDDEIRVPRGGINWSSNNESHSIGNSGQREIMDLGGGWAEYYKSAGTTCYEQMYGFEGAYYLSTRLIMYVL